jgi:hypothetical protein
MPLVITIRGLAPHRRNASAGLHRYRMAAPPHPIHLHSPHRPGPIASMAATPQTGDEIDHRGQHDRLPRRRWTRRPADTRRRFRLATQAVNVITSVSGWAGSSRAA